MIDDRIREFAKGIAEEILSTEVMEYVLLFYEMLAKEKGIGIKSNEQVIYWEELDNELST